MGAILDFFKRLLGITSESPGEPIVGRYWEFPSDYWTDRTWEPDPFLFPEWDRIPAAKRDFGVAFSGGGTRSASATIGQLRGLSQLGWLDKVGYISCVSGGSWASVPYVYSQYDDATILGDYVEPGKLLWKDLIVTQPRSFNNTIATASLNGGQVVFEALRRVLGENTSIQHGLTGVLGHWVDPEGLRGVFSSIATVSKLQREATFARLLATAFLGEQVPGAEDQPFSWHAADAAEIVQANPGKSFPTGFALTHAGRPFVIANAAVLHKMPGFTQSPVPIEYTPLYSGIRQHVSPVLGGMYVWSAAYATHGPSLFLGSQAVHGYVRATTRSASRPFNLSDVLASSGAAPEFLLSTHYGNTLIDQGATEGAAYFPHFPIWSVHDASLGPTLRGVGHADGGAIDNLGLLALLARQVKHVIVFVNANENYAASDDLRAICGVGTSSNSKENHGLCQVFPPERYDEIRAGIARCVADGEPVVHAASGWNVLPNRLFNVQGYDGLNICFVYNFPCEPFRRELPQDVQDRVPVFPNQTTKATDPYLTRFPWYETLAEQRYIQGGLSHVRVLALAPQTTQLLSHLAAWSITHEATVKKIRQHFGSAVA
jgi:hypothetical protein